MSGSIITHISEYSSPNYRVIERLTREIHEARKEKKFKLIVVHGSGSFAHPPSFMYQIHKGIINDESYKGIAVVQDAAARLNRIIVDSLLKVGENAISVQPSTGCITENSKITEWNLKPMKKMLNYNMLVVTYADVGIDLKRGCSIISTDEIINYLAKQLKPKRIIMGTGLDGLYKVNPQIFPEEKIIPEITTEEIDKYRQMNRDLDIIGGMRHKVENIFELSDLGINSMIINAKKPNILKRSLLKKVMGTIIKGNKIIGTIIKQKPGTVFVSYSHKDRDIVDTILSRFESDGIDYWIDYEEMLIGQVIDREISEAIQKSWLFLIVLTPNSISSKWVERELDEASHEEVERGKIILPVVAKGLRSADLPPRIRRKFCADLSDDFESGYAKLKHSIRSYLKKFDKSLEEER